MDEIKQMVVSRWLIKARNDYQTAQTMLKIDPTVTDIVCFHAQQCAEKCLKAYLTHADQHIERTHDLKKLVETCISFDGEFQNLIEPAEALTDYAVNTRYPEDWIEIPFDEAKSAIQNAEWIMDFVKPKLEIEMDNEL